MQQQKSFTCSLGNSAIDNLPIAPERATALTLGLLAGDPGVRMMARTAETLHIDKQDCWRRTPRQQFRWYASPEQSGQTRIAAISAPRGRRSRAISWSQSAGNAAPGAANEVKSCAFSQLAWPWPLSWYPPYQPTPRPSALMSGAFPSSLAPTIGGAMSKARGPAAKSTPASRRFRQMRTTDFGADFADRVGTAI